MSRNKAPVVDKQPRSPTSSAVDLSTSNTDSSSNNNKDVVWMPLQVYEESRKVDTTRDIHQIFAEMQQKQHNDNNATTIVIEKPDNAICDRSDSCRTASTCTLSVENSQQSIKSNNTNTESSSSLSVESNALSNLQILVEKLEQIHDLDEATEYFKIAVYLAFNETSRISNESCNNNGQDYISNPIVRNKLQEQMLRATILISTLRTCMAIKYSVIQDYERAIACCSGARQVLDRNSILEYAETFTSKKGLPLSGSVHVMLEYLLLAEENLEDQRKLFLKIQELYTKVEDPSMNKIEDSVESNKYRAQLVSALTLEQRGRDKATKYLEDALKIYKLTSRNCQPVVSRDHSLLARAFLLQKNDNRARRHFTQAIKLFDNTECSHCTMSSLLNDVAVLRMRKGEFGAAVHLLKASLQSFEDDNKSKEEPNAWKALETLQILKNLGDCYIQEKEFYSAQMAFKKALLVQLDARATHQTMLRMDLGVIGVDQPMIQLIDNGSVTDTYLRLGNAYAAAGKHKEALSVFSDALLEIHQHLVPGNNDIGAQIFLIQTLFCTAEACIPCGQYEKAISLFENALRLKKRLSPTGADAETRTFCAICCLGMAKVYIRKLEYTEAHKKYSDALSYCRMFEEEEESSVGEFIKCLLLETGDKMVAAAMISSADLNRLEERASAEISQGLLDHAISTLTEALLVRKQMLSILKEAQLDCTEEVRALVHLLQRFGALFHMKGDDTNAERSLKESEKLLRKSAESTTTDLFARINIFNLPLQHPSLPCSLNG